MIPSGIIALGLVHGALAAFDALGLVLLYRTTRIVNLAQPSMGLVGGVLTGLLVTHSGWSFWWAAPVGIITGAIVGLLTDRIVLRRLQDVPRAVVLVATVGLAQVFGAIAGALPFIIAGRPVPPYTIDLGFSLYIRPQLLLGPHLLVLGVLPLAWFAAHRFLDRSRFGLAALALGQEVERARALGVPAAAVRAIVWAVAGMLASLSGILSIPVLGQNIGGGLAPLTLLLAITPAVIAGFRSLHVAAISALVLGVVYEAVFYLAQRSGVADLVLGVIVVAAVAFRRRRLGREEAAGRASSWEAATTPRPLARALARMPRVRVLGWTMLALGLLSAALPPIFLEPGPDVAFATAAAFALAAVGVAVAWIFAGEISLGHWGLAAFGAVVASYTPGHWLFRALVAALVLGLAGGLFALASRNRSTLSFAVVSLAAAATAPVAVLKVIGRTTDAPPRMVGAVTAGIGLLAAVGIAWLRRTRIGTQMVAARDDPQRAPWLGADLLTTRVVALSLSTGIAGLAGGLYFASSPIGLTTGGVEGLRSLDLLAVTVIGGLGSPIGAFIGAAAVRAARVLLPGTWSALLSGAGVLIVVIFSPAGLSRILVRLRDVGVRLVTPRAQRTALRNEDRTEAAA